jgi:hypothetical protein
MQITDQWYLWGLTQLWGGTEKESGKERWNGFLEEIKDLPTKTTDTFGPNSSGTRRG